MTTPYEGLPSSQFHSRTIRGRHPSRFDPVVKTRFKLDKTTKIMTMGSCFAQHLSRWLMDHGFNLLLRETESQGGGLFSANYGNVYTVRQALQLHDRAFGNWRANEQLYQNADGRFFDPLRPSAVIDGFDSTQAALADREAHEVHVRDLFGNAQLLVFTLGLTEAWIRNEDGAVLPVAPGVVAGAYEPEQYSFRNFSYDEVLGDLRLLLARLAAVNPSCNVLLTVSPVPLAATYVDRHVSVSSMASKAILRAVVEAILTEFPNVDYFPSLEVFFTPGIGGAYFDYDARHVLPGGVAHAMRLFESHYTSAQDRTRKPEELLQYASKIRVDYMNVNCDEGKIG
ncbi:MAG: GSCFA domain-containing protein [Rhodoferax sp.]